jgi:hypothetical protein
MTHSLFLLDGAPVLSLGGPDRDEKIDALEAAMRAAGHADPVAAGITIHDHFAPGIYAREMRAPAGSIITSKVHKFENLSVLSKGRMALYLEDGTVREACAGLHIVAPPGARRVAFVLEDAVWTCFHNTDERDVEKIEAHFVAPSRAEYRKFIEQEAAMAITNEVQS